MLDLESHYKNVVMAINRGRLVPFFGAGVNLVGRTGETHWQPGQSDCLPSGGELATYLAKAYGYPADQPTDLLRVCQYVSVVNGIGPLYEDLRDIFDCDFTPTSVHAFFANLPRLLSDRHYPCPFQLIVTTNYDDLMERALVAAGQPFDLVCYMAEGEHQGRFMHRDPVGALRVIEKPNEYRGLSLEERTVVMKIHGAVDRADPERDSFVITEDDYIDYLTRTDLATMVPSTLAMHLRRSQFLFLGYSLRDWNLRVILHRIWGKQRLKYKSWAIQLYADQLDREFWKTRDVDILDLDVGEYIAGLKSRLEEPSPSR